MWQELSGRVGFDLRGVNTFTGALITIVACKVTLLSSAWAGDYVLSQATQLGGSGGDYGNAIVVDSEGNTYLTGSFEGVADLDPGPGQVDLTGRGRSEAFLSKYSASGELLWARGFGGSATEEGTCVALGPSGDVFVTGSFSGTVDLDPGLGIAQEVSQGLTDVFVSKFSPAGDFVWGRAFGGLREDYGASLAVDGLGDVYVTGEFYDSADFDPGVGMFVLTDRNNRCAFASKLDQNGNFQWAGMLGRGRDSSGHGIAVDDAGDVLVVGQFDDVSDFDPGAGVYNLSPRGGDEAFFCKLDPAGTLLWAVRMGGSGNDSCSDIAIDSAGNIYGTGTFENVAYFRDGAVDHSINGGIGRRTFVCKLDPAGAFQWCKPLVGSQDNSGTGIAVDEMGSVIITGEFREDADFDPGPDTYPLTGSGFGATFVWKLNESAAFEWAGSFSGSGLPVTQLLSRAVASVPGGNIVAIGTLLGAADFDPGTTVCELTSAGNVNCFILKLEPQAVPVAVDEFGETNADQLLSALSGPFTNSVLTNDTDANTRRTLTVTAFDATSVLGATVVVNPDGTFLYDPTAVGSLQMLATGASRVDSFTYTLSDGTDTDVGMVTVTVYGPGTKLPVVTILGAGLLCVALAVAGVRACMRRKVAQI